jgi:nanoRNase/pAp phosphatase (c-di-AMP/oligoRNAs hydrolase)
MNKKHLPEVIDNYIDVFISFLSSLKPDQRVVLSYHTDMDGVCAAVATRLLIEGIGRKNKITLNPIQTHQFDFIDFWKKISSHSRSEAFVCLDLNLSSNSSVFEELVTSKRCDLVVVDDHRVVTDFKRPVLYLNPNFGTADAELSFAPSLFAYLAGIKRSIQIPSWLPALGLLADRQFETNGQYLQLPVPAASELSDAVVMLSAPYLDGKFGGSNDRVFELLNGYCATNTGWKAVAKNIRQEDFLSLSRANITFALDKNTTHFESSELQNRTNLPETVLFEQVDQTKITNIIASTIRKETPNSIVAVIRNDGETRYLELRAGAQVEEVDIPRVLSQIDKRVKLRNFGGHARAAGCAVSAQNFPALCAILKSMKISDWRYGD